MKRAILFGASGHVGGYLLEALLNDPAYGTVTVVVRKALPLRHEKLRMLVGDYASLPDLKEQLTGDEIYIILGAADKIIDRNYPVLAATLAKANGVSAAFVVTAVGADPHSGMSYLKVKGEIELDLTALNFEHVHFFRPSMIMGRKGNYRPMERMMMGIWSALQPMFTGALKKYKGIKGKDIAGAMLASAARPSQKVNIYHWQEMKALL